MHAIKIDAVAEFRKFLAKGKRKDQFGNMISIPDNAMIVGDARRIAEIQTAMDDVYSSGNS